VLPGRAVPDTPDGVTEVMTGGAIPVFPLSERKMPTPPFIQIRFLVMVFRVVESWSTKIPCDPLKEIVLEGPMVFL
jgi:hypothetical protein